MVRSLLLAAALFLSLTASAKTYLVVLVDINCPVCRTLHDVDQPIKDAATAAGIEFRYAPISNTGSYVTAWPERSYYACANIKSCDQSQLLAALYKSQDSKRIEGKGDLQVWLDTSFSTDPALVDRLISAAEEQQSKDALVRAMRLAAAVKISHFPTFAVLGDGEPYQISGGRDTPLENRVKDVISWLNKQVKK